MSRADSFEPLSIKTEAHSRKAEPAATPLLAAVLHEQPLSEFEVIEEIHDLVINRKPGQGLGVSIAGGKGSPPYKGNDEVSTWGRRCSERTLQHSLRLALR